MKNISDLIARKEYFPVTEDIQQELIEIFDKKRVEKDSLIKKFATGVISGAISATVTAFICTAFIQLIPPKQKLTDWKVRIVAYLFFTMTCASIIKYFLDVNGFLRSNPWFDQVIVRNSWIKNGV